MKKITQILKDLREDHDLTQQQVAEAIGKTQSYYYRYESGKYGLPFNIAIQLADYYNVTTDYLAGRTTSMLNVDIFNKIVLDEYTVGELLNDFYSLSETGKRDIIKYIEILKTKEHGLK